MRKESRKFLWMGLGFSMALHLLFFQSSVFLADLPVKPIEKKSTLVSVNMVKKQAIPVPEKKIEKPKPEPKPEPKPKPKPEPKIKPEPKLKPKPRPKPKPMPKTEPKPEKKEIAKMPEKTTESELPVSHIRKADADLEKQSGVKPVFGVTKNSVAEGPGSGISVRIGNTLMKEQEAEYTPPEEVEDYYTVPAFEVSTMPVFITRVKPEYPEELKIREIEGEVLVSVTIDKTGKVVRVTVTSSDHPLFAEAAVAAIKRSRFEPATLNGEPVATIVDGITYSFIIDES